MNAHFIEFDIIVKSESRPWVIDKNNPSQPIMKMDNYEFNLFKSGIYKGQNNKMDFNGKTFWVPNEFIDKLKILTKRLNIDMSNVAISMQEYLNKDITKDVPYQINMDFFNTFINSEDDIYIICSKNTEDRFKNQIEKFESGLSKMKLSAKKFYFISDTYYEKDDDHLAYLKCKILLQHLTGLKVESDRFSDEKTDKYQQISFYDDNKKSVKLAMNINKIMEQLLMKSEHREKLIVKDLLKNSDILLIIKEYTHNKISEFKDTIVELEYSNIIRNFENFNYKI